MKIIIYDTEFTAWEGSLQRAWSGPNEHRELIQFSAIKLEILESVHPLEQLNCFVKPSINNTLSTYIKQLTGITQTEVDQGSSSQQLFQSLANFTESGKIPMFSWGHDIEILKETAELNHAEIDWVNSYNLQPLFEPFEVPPNYSSGNLYQFFNLPLELHGHNAEDDTISLFESLKFIHKTNPKNVHDFFSLYVEAT